jgi:hypothetical protein
MMVESAPGRKPSVVPLVLTWVSAVVVPVVLSAVAWFRAYFDPEGASPPPIVHIAVISAAVLAVVSPAFGLFLAMKTGRPRNAFGFGVAIVTAVVVMIEFSSLYRAQKAYERDPPSPRSTITHCVAYSGSTNMCPGG